MNLLSVGKSLRTARIWLGPLAPMLAMALTWLGLFGLSRLCLFFFYHERLVGLASPWRMFVIGFRVDATLVAYLSTISTLLLLLPDKPNTGIMKRIVRTYWIGLTYLILFLEISTIPFIGEYDIRPNRLMFEYLNHPREVMGTVGAEYGALIVVVVPLVGLLAWACWRLNRRVLDGLTSWSRTRRAFALLPTLLVLFVVARGSFSHRPLNISTAAFSDNGLANQLALDSTYSLLYAIYSLRHEMDPAGLYGHMTPEEIRREVFSAANIPIEAGESGELSVVHRQVSPTPRERPLNLVIILEESLGAEFVGCLGGLPLTPNLDRLSEQGLLLRNLYSTGVRTVRGIEAVVSGFPPTPGRSVVKLDLSQHGFFTLADLLAREGYRTEFIYGGESHFDDMRSFFRGNGFEKIHDEPTFEREGYRGIWGFSDEDLFIETDRILREHGDEPFFALVLTTTNHSPFEFPEGRIELYEQPANTRHNAMKFADYAIGEFFSLVAKSDYADNTLFLIVADHNTRTYGNELVPIKKFHIPGLILGPGVSAATNDEVASQIDLAPTLLDLMGLSVEHPMIGRSLVRGSDPRGGRAIMQFRENHAYRVGDQVVIHQPHRQPVQFTYVDGQLIPATLDQNLAREALAHALFPGWQYSSRSYHLPER